jgi:hypothetical protein
MGFQGVNFCQLIAMERRGVGAGYQVTVGDDAVALFLNHRLERFTALI